MWWVLGKPVTDDAHPAGRQRRPGLPRREQVLDDGEWLARM